MRKKKEYFYNFNIDKEYELYRAIGCQKSRISKYTDWENHIEKILEKFSSNTQKNFKHYLIKMRREQENILTTIDTLWTNSNVFVLTILLTFIFAFVDTVIAYNTECISCINEMAKLNSQVDYIGFLSDLERNFEESQIFYGIVSLIMIGLEVLLYKLGKERRKNTLCKIEFYMDIIEIIEKDL